MVVNAVTLENFRLRALMDLERAPLGSLTAFCARG